MWEKVEASPIGREVAVEAKAAALHRLDNGFFCVRFDRLTPRERAYVHAMARLGAWPYRSSDVAAEIRGGIKRLAPQRDTLINKGMIYSPAYDDVDFIVPMYDDFLRRTTNAIGPTGGDHD